MEHQITVPIGVGGADEETKVIYETDNFQPGNVGDVGIGDDYNCGRCGKARPPHYTESNDDYLWIECNKCEKWSHADCVRDKLKKLGVHEITSQSLEDIEIFYCCEGI